MKKEMSLGIIDVVGIRREMDRIRQEIIQKKANKTW